MSTVTFNEDYLAQLAGLPTAEMKSRIIDKLYWCLTVIDMPTPTITYDLKGGVAGTAYYSENRIALNVDYLYQDTEDMIKDTLVHEFAHLASYHLYGNKGTGHNDYWRHTMRQLGLEPKRTHDYQVVPARQTEKFVYVCSGCYSRIRVGKNVHNKIQNGQLRSCGKCATTVRPLDFSHRV